MQIIICSATLEHQNILDCTAVLRRERFVGFVCGRCIQTSRATPYWDCPRLVELMNMLILLVFVNAVLDDLHDVFMFQDIDTVPQYDHRLEFLFVKKGVKFRSKFFHNSGQLDSFHFHENHPSNRILSCD